MQFLGWFVRLPQSKVFQTIANKMLSLVGFALRSPVRAVIYIVKFYVTLMLLSFCLITFFVSFGAKATTVFDRAANSVPAATSASCDTQQSTSEKLADMNEDLPIMNPGSTYFTKWQLISSREEIQSDTACRIRMFVRRETGHLGTDGNRYQSRDTDQVLYLNGAVATAPSCDNLGNNTDGSQSYPQHKVLGQSGGQNRCYRPIDLTDASSCSQNNDMLADASSPANVCKTMPDESKCAMEKYEVNGAFAYSQMVEPSTCFDGPLSAVPYDGPDFTPPVEDDDGDDSECSDIGNGVTACTADPNDVCPNGECQSGCGTFEVGGESAFLCLSGNPDPNEPVDPLTAPTPVDITGEEYDTVRGTNTLLANQGSQIGLLTQIGQSTRETQIQTRSAIIANGNEAKIQTGLLRRIAEGIEGEEESEGTTPANFGSGSDLYEKNDYEVKNYGTVMAAALEELQQAPITEAVNSFFDLSLSGSCPVYSTTVPGLGTSIVIDQFCSSAMQSIWPIVRGIMLLVFSVLAFRVAIL